jgi:hypothetical protein
MLHKNNNINNIKKKDLFLVMEITGEFNLERERENYIMIGEGTRVYNYYNCLCGLKYFPLKHENKKFNIAMINREYTNHINMFLIYDTNIINNINNNNHNHFINKKIIENIILLFKKYIKFYNFCSTIKIIPQTRNYNYSHLEIIASNMSENTQHKPIKTIFNEYIDSSASYRYLEPKDIMKYFLYQINRTTKNLMMYIENAEGFSYNIPIIFSDNFENYSMYIFTIIKEYEENKKLNNFSYSYILRSGNYINFVLLTRGENYCSRLVDIDNNKDFEKEFYIFLQKILFDISSQMRIYINNI